MSLTNNTNQESVQDSTTNINDNLTEMRNIGIAPDTGGEQDTYENITDDVEQLRSQINNKLTCK